MGHQGKYLANSRPNLAVLGQKSNLGHPTPSSQNPEYFDPEDFTIFFCDGVPLFFRVGRVRPGNLGQPFQLGSRWSVRRYMWYLQIICPKYKEMVNLHGDALLLFAFSSTWSLLIWRRLPATLVLGMIQRLLPLQPNALFRTCPAMT